MWIALIWLGVGSMILSSCNLTKLVPKDRTLLQRNKFEGFDEASNSDLNEQIKHQPNRKILGVVKFHLWAYQVGAKHVINRELQDTGRIRKLLMNTVGEPPVLTDTMLIRKSAENLKAYVFNKGYFDVKVKYTSKTFLKRTTITYWIEEGPVYKISSVKLICDDKDIYQLVEGSSANAKIRAGKPTDFDLMAAERERIAALLKNNGYYNFNKAFIDFKLDTLFNQKSAVISVNIRMKSDGSHHKPQIIRKVTVAFETGQAEDETIKSNGVFYKLNGFNLKMPILNSSVIIGEKQLFRQQNVDVTYSKLLGLGLFKFVNIVFNADTSLNGLECLIQLAPAPKHDFIWEPQVITTERSLGLQNNLGRNYGIANEFILRNKNVFGNAEEFNISWRTTFETQFNAQSNLGPLSNISNNFSLNLTFPKLIGLKKLDRNVRFQNNKTILTASFLDERNPNFSRTVLPFSYSYQLNKKLLSYYLTPFQISFNKAEVNSNFRDQLNAKDSLFIARLFSNYLITGPKFALYYSNKTISPKNYLSINSNVLELSGLLFSKLFTDQKILGVPFSRFVRSDVDIRYHHQLDENNKVVYRAYLGLGYPLGDAFFPFERRFFVGGSNSLRAWRPRTIGPGSYSDNQGVQIDKSGEMLLQGNLEYRFVIFKGILEGALFMDAGNIWNVKADSIFNNAKFQFNRFYNEFAINTGLGLRADFSFFIIRADWGIPLHDPSYPLENRWVISNLSEKKWFFTQTLMNIAIGYPF
jgi:outer membrane protein assembly factor BamA